MSMVSSPQQIHNDEWSIELLRGIAAMMVVIAHYWSLTGFEIEIMKFLFTGVDLFFVISGFVFGPYVFGKQLSVVPHLIRRVFRIYPLYLVSLLLYAGLRVHQGLSVEHIFVHLFFLHTIESIDIAFYFNPAYWSLPPEIEFYIILPLLVIYINNLRRVVYLFMAALLTHLVLSYLSIIDAGAVNVFAILNVHLPGLLVEFLLGSFAYFVVSRKPTGSVRVAMLLSGVALWILLSSIFLSFYSAGGDQAVVANDVLRGNVGLFSAFTFALVVAASVGWICSPPGWFKSASVMLGNLSFGLYLFHNAAPRVLDTYKTLMSGPCFAIACFVLTIVLSAVMHLYLERPLRNFGRTFAQGFSTKKS